MVKEAGEFKNVLSKEWILIRKDILKKKLDKTNFSIDKRYLICYFFYKEVRKN